MTAELTNNRASLGLPVPTLGGAHWFLRLPLAAIILNEGVTKFPDLAAGAAAFGLPLFLWVLVALGEIAAGAGLLVGGAIRNRFGDLITRASGLVIAGIVAGVILLVYLGPWTGMQFHLMLLAGGLFFMLRGNQS
ncbi:MAG: hypothetical protein AAGE18_15520 [Pseudomonadota bacterium]